MGAHEGVAYLSAPFNAVVSCAAVEACAPHPVPPAADRRASGLAIAAGVLNMAPRYDSDSIAAVPLGDLDAGWA